MPPPRRGRAAPAARSALPRAAARTARARAAAVLDTDEEEEEEEEADEDQGAALSPAAGSRRAAGLPPLPSPAAACTPEQAAATIGMAALLQQQAAAAVARANAATAAAAGLWAGLPLGAQGQQAALLRQLGLAAPYPLGTAPNPEQQAAADATLQSPTGTRALAPIRTHARRPSNNAALAGGTALRTLSTGPGGVLAEACGWALSPLGGLDLPSPLGLPRSATAGSGGAAVARRDSFLSLLSGLSGAGTPSARGGGDGGGPGHARKDSLLGLSNEDLARLLSGGMWSQVELLPAASAGAAVGASVEACVLAWTAPPPTSTNCSCKPACGRRVGGGAGARTGRRWRSSQPPALAEWVPAGGWRGGLLGGAELAGGTGPSTGAWMGWRGGTDEGVAVMSRADSLHLMRPCSLRLQLAALQAGTSPPGSRRSSGAKQP